MIEQINEAQQSGALHQACVFASISGDLMGIYCVQGQSGPKATCFCEYCETTQSSLVPGFPHTAHVPADWTLWARDARSRQCTGWQSATVPRFGKPQPVAPLRVLTEMTNQAAAYEAACDEYRAGTGPKVHSTDKYAADR